MSAALRLEETLSTTISMPSAALTASMITGSLAGLLGCGFAARPGRSSSVMSPAQSADQKDRSNKLKPVFGTDRNLDNAAVHAVHARVAPPAWSWAAYAYEEPR